MGWIVLGVVALAGVAFCIWYVRKDIESALSLMTAFWIKRIRAKVAKIIGKADLVEEGAKAKALDAIANAKSRMDDEFDHLMSWVANRNVIKKE